MFSEKDIPQGFKIELGKLMNKYNVDLTTKAYLRNGIYELICDYFDLS